MLRRPEFQWTVLMAALVAAFAHWWTPPRPVTQTEEPEEPILIADIAQTGLDGLIQSARKSPVVFSYPALTSGALIPNTSHTVSHVTWNGTALVEQYGVSWTQNGTVPQVSGAIASPLYPNGFSGGARAGSGPYTDSNYYTAPANSPLAFAGDFTLCAVFNLSTLSAVNSTLASVGDGSTTGWYLEVPAAGNLYLGVGSGGVNVATANVAITQGVNVGCVGRAGTTIYAQLNGGTVATQTGAGTTQDTTDVAYLGRYTTTNFFVHGYVYELWASTDTPSAVSLTAISYGALSEVAAVGGQFPLFRTSVATYYAGGYRWNAPPNVPRIEVLTDGGVSLMLEPASTNLLLNSEAPVTQTTASLGVASYTGSSLGTGGIVFTAGTATTTGLPCTTTTYKDVGEGGDCHFTVTVSGTVVATVSGLVTREQLEGLPYRTSDIVTGGTATTRAGDIPNSVNAIPMAPNSLSLSEDIIDLGVTGGNAALGQRLVTSGSVFVNHYLNNAGNLVVQFEPAGVDYTVTSTAALSFGPWGHVLQKYDGTNIYACVNGTCTSSAQTFANPSNYSNLFLSDATYPIAGRIRNVCIAKTAGGCQ